MTVQAELDSGEATVEFILCVEGIGFPRDPSDLSELWDGTVFTTGDLNGDLAATLGCTVAPGLELPESVGDRLDLRSYVYSPGGLEFSIIDHDDVWLNKWIAVNPDVANNTESIIKFDQTTIRINETDFNSAEKDIIWISGSEAILLGPRALISGIRYEYTSCQRGYAGTTRGNYNPRNATTGGFTWKSATAVYEKNPRWKDRRVALFMHVPGEARANCVRLYSGVIADINVSDIALRWNISTVARLCPATQRSATQPTGWEVLNHQFIALSMGTDKTWSHTGTMDTGWFYQDEFPDVSDSSNDDHAFLEIQQTGGGSAYDRWGPIWAYNYRSQPGSTKQAYTNITADDTDPLTLELTYGDYNRYFVYGVWSVGGSIFRVVFKEPLDLASTESKFTKVITRLIDPVLGNSFASKADPGTSVRFLIDNVSSSWLDNRFYRGKSVAKNPIDLMLMFFTSMPGEYLIFDTSGAGTTTRANESGSSLGTSGLFDGYALHCMDAAEDNLREARVITDHEPTYIDVSPGYDNATDGSAEYQVRNTEYDVLPAPFCMGIHNKDIDIESFETVRDVYLSDAEVGKFAFGEDGDDIWEIFQENICRPYGLVLYQDRTTGKLACKHIPPFNAIENDINESVISIADSDIIAIEDVEMMPEVPIVEYELLYRARKQITIRRIVFKAGAQGGIAGGAGRTVRYQQNDSHGVLLSGDEGKIVIRTPDREIIRPSEENGTETVRAMFHDSWTISPIAEMLADRLRGSPRGLPRTRIHLDMSFILTVQVGVILKITSSTIAPIDPSTGTRGWTNLLARVVGTTIKLDPTNPGIIVEIRLLGSSVPDVGIISPACSVTGKGTHGAGPEYFDVDNNVYIDRSSGGDWFGFQVGDLVELRDITGALKEAEEIESFGANESNSTTMASTDTVNVVGSIASSIAAGDYLTFAQYVSATATTNMKKYSYYADSDETLDADVGQSYG